MIEYVTSFFNKKKTKKIPLRDKNGKAYYLTKLPFYARYPKTTLGVGGGILLFSLLSAPIIRPIFWTEEDYPEKATWWKHEIRNGKRDIDILRERKKENPDAHMSYYFKNYDKHEERRKAMAKKASEEQLSLKA